MVGSSLSDDERRAANKSLRALFILLVGVSAGLVAFSGGATPIQSGVAATAGFVVGGVLLWFLVRMGRQIRRRN
jgi:lysozyme family protein